MKNIIIDTNAWMATIEFGIDLFRELEKTCNFPYKITTVSRVIEELQNVVETQRGKYTRAAKLSLDIISKKNVEIIPSKGFVDDTLIAKSSEGDIILTQDKELKSKLHKPYLTIRQKKYIVLIE